jgi:polysaccharide export outer membrane protein
MACVLLLWGAPVFGQQGSADLRPEATRAELEALYAKVKPEERGFAAAVALRERLDQGDFQTGDKVVLHVAGDTALNDTFTVNEHGGLDLPNIGEVSLHGVLRSELAEHLRSVVSRYIRSVDLRAESLMRITVVGQVARPGFYNLPAVAVLADVFTAAGGLTSESDIPRSEVRRNGQVFLEPEVLQSAITSGRTLDQMNLHSGDEINVAQKKHASVSSTIFLVGGIATALLSIVALVALVK